MIDTDEQAAAEQRVRNIALLHVEALAPFGADVCAAIAVELLARQTPELCKQLLQKVAKNIISRENI